MLPPVVRLNGSIGNWVAAVNHHPVADINAHMGCATGVVGFLEEDQVSGLCLTLRDILFCYQQRTHDIFVTGTNLFGMICINYFVLITGLELQPMIEKRLDAERVFLISTGSELVVRMLGQIVFI